MLMSAAAFGHAQTASNVTVYGLVDTGVEHVTNVATGGGNTGSLTRMPTNTGNFPSRIGFRGTEDLGAGLKAVFTLENGFGPDTGGLNQGGRLFGRQAFVGLSGDWGTVSVGRQYTMLFWGTLDADILGSNVFGSGSLDSYLPNARADNSIAYRGTFSGFTVGATYSLGRDATNVAVANPAANNCAGENAADSKQCREYSALLKYDAPTWGALVAYDRKYGGSTGNGTTIGPTFDGLTNSGLTDTRTTVNGYVKLGQAKVGGGVILRKNEGSATPKSNLYFVGAAYSITPAFVVDGEVYRLDTKDSPNDSNLFAVRGTYNFSKRTAAYVTAGRINNSGAATTSVSSGAPGSNSLPGGSQTGLMVGMRHAF
ncbi:porin [Noviherbaspirillum cavernae]|uniref:Porin n=2 Tax=Noviherbaspirillum cavernae TaxID=2320862 RepID=A0A418WX11_9BURK|nr:porin [Noviherbaspirillum cavernae]RJF97081.1 porin [Noviherbaspirillum cavernae]